MINLRWPLLTGILVLLFYGVLIPILGFLLSSILFMVSFIYIGGYRRAIVIGAASLTTALVIALLFLRLAYVSLPRGMPPFDAFTDLVRIGLGG